MNYVKEIHGNAVAKGFWENPNVERAILLIISEVYEAFEAFRSSKIYIGHDYKDNFEFEMYIKDTFQDEIADVIIRLTDLYGFGGIEPTGRYLYKKIDLHINSIESGFMNLNKYLLMLYDMNLFERAEYIPKIIEYIEYLYSFMGFRDLDFHIRAKIGYNKSRPYKHGKKF